MIISNYKRINIIRWIFNCENKIKIYIIWKSLKYWFYFTKALCVAGPIVGTIHVQRHPSITKLCAAKSQRSTSPSTLFNHLAEEYWHFCPKTVLSGRRDSGYFVSPHKDILSHSSTKRRHHKCWNTRRCNRLHNRTHYWRRRKMVTSRPSIACHYYYYYYYSYLSSRQAVLVALPMASD